MNISSVTANNHKHAFEVVTAKGTLSFPYARCDPQPSATDPLAEVYVDDELGREAFTYVLKSGGEGSVHVEALLDYNEDPEYLRELLVYKLTLAAQRCFEESGLSTREVARRLHASQTQLYRLLDQENTRKSIDRLVVLLRVLGREVDFRIGPIVEKSPTACVR